MSAWRTALAGMVGLALLDATVSSQQAAGRVGGLLQGVAKTLEHLLSPTVAAIPDLRKHGGAIPQGASDTSPAGGSGVVGASLLPADWTTSPSPPTLNA